jgi:hypothetical protein
MQRDIYPPTWEHLAQEAKERAGWMCEVCMVPHGAIVLSPRTGNPYVVYLQAAHVNHDHDNPSPELIAVCPQHHKQYFSKPKTKRAPAWPCQRLQAMHQRYEARKKLARNRQVPGASNEMILSKNMPTSPSYSNRVQFGWQLLEEGRDE